MAAFRSKTGRDRVAGNSHTQAERTAGLEGSKRDGGFCPAAAIRFEEIEKFSQRRYIGGE